MIVWVVDILSFEPTENTSRSCATSGLALHRQRRACVAGMAMIEWSSQKTLQSTAFITSLDVQPTTQVNIREGARGVMQGHQQIRKEALGCENQRPMAPSCPLHTGMQLIAHLSRRRIPYTISPALGSAHESRCLPWMLFVVCSTMEI